MFTNEHVRDVIDNLNQVFVSEAHFQLAFAILAQKKYPGFLFYPEYPLHDTGNANRDEFDLLILDKSNDEKTLIEFKYKTRNHPPKSGKAQVVFVLESGAKVCLADQAAQNNGYYDSWKDIYRIERHVEKGTVKNGFFILLTNDWRYWKGKKNESRKTAIDTMYMNEDSCGELHKAGKRGFSDTDVKDHGGRKTPLDIKNDYSFHYIDYRYTPIPQQGDERYLKFKYLIVSVGS